MRKLVGLILALVFLWVYWNTLAPVSGWLLALGVPANWAWPVAGALIIVAFFVLAGKVMREVRR